jgi:hypothetical protein
VLVVVLVVTVHALVVGQSTAEMAPLAAAFSRIE